MTCIHHQAPGAYNYRDSLSASLRTGMALYIGSEEHNALLVLIMVMGLEIIGEVFVQEHCRAINLFVLLFTIRLLQACDDCSEVIHCVIFSCADSLFVLLIFLWLALGNHESLRGRLLCGKTHGLIDSSIHGAPNCI